jgi:hypothetical protein
MIGCFVAVIAWMSLHPYDEDLKTVSDIATTCLVVAGAVVTADFVGGRRQIERVRRFDWVAIAAFVAGMAAPLCLPSRYGWGPVMPSYGVGFGACFCGRALRKAAVRHGHDKVPE